MSQITVQGRSARDASPPGIPEGKAPGSPARVTGLDVARFLAVAAQLGLLLAVIDLYKVEELGGFLLILPLIFGGFLVHSCLPMRLRPPFFLLLSLAAIVVVFGKHAIGLVGLGLGLIGICHLPIPKAARAALLIVAGAALAAIRAEWIPVSWKSLPTLVLPMLASMFMFRVVVYLYDMRREARPASIWERLSYFFLLPNVCFPMFPVVDFQTYRRTYYDSASHEIYQKGLSWMFRGVFQLLLYRLVYYHVLPSPVHVRDLGGLVLFMVSNYLLYLRISGQFHLIIGMLCLFGFNLPETHHLYLLASGFNDYWRRINIYWKDFMQKVVFYPSFFRLRRWGMTAGLALSTAVVFAATWVLHSYQWFWLRGKFPVTATDGLFWGILGAAVVANSLREASRGRKRPSGAQAPTLRDMAMLSLRTVGMFALICVLWSLWSSPSVGAWLSLLSAAGKSGAGDWALLLAGLLALVGAGVLVQWALDRGKALIPSGGRPSFARSVAFTGSGAFILAILALPGVQGRLGGRPAELLASLGEVRLNRWDEERLQRGYYEELVDSDQYTSALWTIRAGKPRDWLDADGTSRVRPTGDIRTNELIPSYAGEYKQVGFRTNRWGMRDRDYEKAKPPGTYRIALLGASYEVGGGVEPGRVFESIVEDRLNREHGGRGHDRYEILNFAVEGYGIVQNVAMAEGRALSFDPDTLFLAFHLHTRAHTRNHLTGVIREGTEIPYPELAGIVERSGARQGMEEPEIHRRLEPHLDEILRWGLRALATACRQRGVTPVWVYVPVTEEAGKGWDAARFSQMHRYASEAGLVTLSLEGAYGDHALSSIQLAPWDTHANTRGHALIADRLYEVLGEQDVLDIGIDREEGRNPAAADEPVSGEPLTGE